VESDLDGVADYFAVQNEREIVIVRLAQILPCYRVERVPCRSEVEFEVDLRHEHTGFEGSDVLRYQTLV
jgi:hypothetical protein